MSDFEQKDLEGKAAEPVPQPETPASPEAPAVETVSAPAAQETPDADQVPSTSETQRPVPHLTLEPDPAIPEIPEPQTVPSSAEAFHMPPPPKAPEPPQNQPQQPSYGYQQTPPQYGSAQNPYENPQYAPPQYGAPQYGASQYGAPYGQQYYQPQYNTPPAGYLQKSRLAAGLLAIMFGCLGVHNYYLGNNSRATIQLIVTLLGGLITCGIAAIAMVIWGFVEGVMILSANPSRLYDGNGVILRD